MKVALKDAGTFILRFDQGEDVLEELKKFCVTNQIEAAWFSGHGACDTLTLAFYNLEAKQYEEKHTIEPLEVASLTGNVGSMNGTPTVHAHGVFANRNYHATGGHVRRLIVSTSIEIFLTRLHGVLKRVPDLDTKRNVLR